MKALEALKWNLPETAIAAMMIFFAAVGTLFITPLLFPFAAAVIMGIVAKEAIYTIRMMVITIISAVIGSSLINLFPYCGFFGQKNGWWIYPVCLFVSMWLGIGIGMLVRYFTVVRKYRREHPVT